MNTNVTLSPEEVQDAISYLMLHPNASAETVAKHLAEEVYDEMPMCDALLVAQEAIRRLTDPLTPAAEFPGYLKLALKMASLGIPVELVEAGTKACRKSGWQDTCSTDANEIVARANAKPNWTNYALVAKAVPGGHLFLDDDGGIRAEYEKVHGGLAATLKQKSRSGAFHYIYKHSAKSLQYWQRSQKAYISEKKPTGTGELWSLRIHNSYIVGAGSIVEGGFYEIVYDTTIAEIPDSLLDFLIERYENSEAAEAAEAAEATTKMDTNPTETVQSAELTGAKLRIVEGARNNSLAIIAGELRRKGLNEAEMLPVLLRRNQEECEPPLDDDEVKTICRSIAKKPFKDTRVLFDGVPAGVSRIGLPEPAPVSTEFLSNGETTVVGDTEFAMTPAEYESEMENDWAVLPLVLPAGPCWDDDILYGLAGRIIQKAAAYNESHPAGMYLDLLVSIGSMFGRSAYFNINQTRHYTNEFLARIGQSSISRKGTGRDAVDAILAPVDPVWSKERVMRGFGSPQAIINEIRDSLESNIWNDNKREYEQEITPGVDDKRLCIREGELANVFQLASMPGSRTDVILRDGWDGKPLDNRVRGVTQDGFTNTLRCLEPHISISGDSTVSELVRKMPTGSDENGFGNRFLYCFTYRTKLCPLGGPPIDWSAEMLELLAAIDFGKQQGCVGLSRSAEKMWRRMYLDLETNRPAGLAGRMTARAPSHVRRISLILAMLDQCGQVESRHLHAARRIWDYCEESAEYIFSGCTREQHRILDWIELNCASGKTVTVTQVCDGLFKWNRKATWVRAQVNELARQGFLTIRGEQISRNSRKN